MKDLIARLEKASGPDRELDCEIARIATDCRWSEIGLTRYTASIDAALTLVPEKWELDELLRHVEHSNDHQFGEQDYGVVLRRLDDVGYTTSDDTIGAHDSLAIALCIAALRARAALSGKGEAS